MFAFPVAFFSSAGSGYFKPVSRAGSGTNPDYAYDGTGTPGTTTTSATMVSFAAGLTFKYETYTFSGATAYTKYKIYLTMDWTADEVYGEETVGYGRVVIQYSLNGTTWVSATEVPAINLSGSYSYTTPIDLGTLASTSLDSFKVRIGVASTRVLAFSEPVITYEYATASVTIKDIYISAEN